MSLMFFMIREVFLLMESFEKENNITYKNIAKARADVVHDCYYPNINWDIDFGDKIYVPEYPWSGVGEFAMNDHFAIGRRDIMEKYFKFYDNMKIPAEKFKTNELGSVFPCGKKTKAWSPEHSLSIYLHSQGINWKKISSMPR